VKLELRAIVEDLRFDRDQPSPAAQFAPVGIEGAVRE